jgi:hypothetical protein
VLREGEQLAEVPLLALGFDEVELHYRASTSLRRLSEGAVVDGSCCEPTCDHEARRLLAVPVSCAIDFEVADRLSLQSGDAS